MVLPVRQKEVKPAWLFPGFWQVIHMHTNSHITKCCHFFSVDWFQQHLLDYIDFLPLFCIILSHTNSKASPVLKHHSSHSFPNDSCHTWQQAVNETHLFQIPHHIFWAEAEGCAFIMCMTMHLHLLVLPLPGVCCCFHLLHDALAPSFWCSLICTHSPTPLLTLEHRKTEGNSWNRDGHLSRQVMILGM